MILANLRQRLTADDFALVASVLTRRDPARAERYRTLADTCALALLDTPGLPGLLREAPGHAAPSAALFVFVAVRHALRAAAVEDERLADYCGALVLEFGFRDRAYRIAPHDDATYRYVADLVAAAEVGDRRRQFLVQVHLGNFSLWLAGIFPDYITARRARRGGPDFAYFDTLGARGFRMAADDRLARELDVADLFQRAADDFARMRIALNRLSDQAFFRAVATPDRLLRQVQDAARLPEGTPPLF